MCSPKRAQRVVGGVVGRDGRDAEHPLRLVEVLGERGLPVVLEARPLRVLVEARARAVQRVRVAEAAAADAGAADDRHVLEERQAEDPVQAQARREEVAAQVPGGLRELVVGEPPAGLEDADAVALLGQPVRGDAATEPGSHDDPVEVMLAGRPCHERQRTVNMTGASHLAPRQRVKRTSSGALPSSPAATVVCGIGCGAGARSRRTVNVSARAPREEREAGEPAAAPRAAGARAARRGCARPSRCSRSRRRRSRAR